MKRTLEQLAQERQDKENDFSLKLDELKRDGRAERLGKSISTLEPVFERLKELLRKEQRRTSTRRMRLGRLIGLAPRENAASAFHEHIYIVLREQQGLLAQNQRLLEGLAARQEELFRLQAALIDAKDKEWDALGSNHVGLIFKSLEWRVDQLAAEHEDVRTLMKKFIHLRERLDRLLAALAEKKGPAPEDVRDILEPLEDWRYAGFENRFRGREEEVRAQLIGYLAELPTEGPILDLGCGRGEFLELLRESGREASGVDLNSQMVEICRDKGLHCEKGDLLETLGARPDGSLMGIFSSQVIEHLSPPQLQRLVELCRVKLAPGGTLVLETVNPVSVFALVQVYFLDLSHRNPIHPQALKFLLQASGFDTVEIRYGSVLEAERLKNLPGADERTALLNRNIDSLNDLLFAPVNYAAIARRR